MRIVEGFVCLVTRPEARAFFGRNLGNGPNSYANFESNGFTTFDLLSEAKMARDELLKLPDTQHVTIHKIKMEIAESAVECKELRHSKHLEVIAYLEMGPVLLGRSVPGKRGLGYIPGVMLADAPHAVFRRYSAVLDTLHQVHRQGASDATLTTFEIETC